MKIGNNFKDEGGLRVDNIKTDHRDVGLNITGSRQDAMTAL
jgi:hypothetical protein